MYIPFSVSLDNVNDFLKKQGYEWKDDQVIDKQTGNIRRKRDADIRNSKDGINIVVNKDGLTKNVVLSYSALGFCINDNGKDVDFSDMYQDYLLSEHKKQYADYMIGFADWNIKKIVKDKMQSTPSHFGKNDKDAIALGGCTSAESVADAKRHVFNKEEQEKIDYWKSLKSKAKYFMLQNISQPGSY